MTSPISEPPGLGVGPDKIRRWQDRGLIAPRKAIGEAVRPQAVVRPGLAQESRFAPIIGNSLPASRIDQLKEPGEN